MPVYLNYRARACPQVRGARVNASRNVLSHIANDVIQLYKECYFLCTWRSTAIHIMLL